MGLDIGMNNVGIPTLLACESNKYCRMTINENNKNIALIGDITKYTSQEILKMANIPEGRKVDIIFGGPPCQPLAQPALVVPLMMNEAMYFYIF